MRRAAYPSVHHSFMVRVLDPLKHLARERHMPLQSLLRLALERVRERSAPGRPELWLCALPTPPVRSRAEQQAQPAPQTDLSA